MTIRKRPDRDGWLVQVEMDGVRIRRQVATKWDAERMERQLSRALRDNRAHLTLEECLLGYQMALRTRGRPKTLKSAEYHGSILTREFEASYNVAELTERDVTRFVAHARHAKLRDASINGTLRVLRAALNLAVREGKLDKACRIQMLRETRKLPTILSADEVEKLVRCASPRAGLAILLAAHAGLRHQEILHLQWSDISGGEIRVTAKGDWRPKSAAERTVPINARLASVLERRVGGWVFPAADGKRPLPSLGEDVREAFKAACLWNLDRRPGLHMLRRTFASRLLAAGVDVETVRELGGWSDLKVVQRYLASTDDLKRRAVAALEG